MSKPAQQGATPQALPDVADRDAEVRELRHRFRNSLQFLNSLVGLHAKRVSDPQARLAFNDLRNRLVTVAWISDAVDVSGADLIGLADLLPRLARQVSSLYEPQAQRPLAFELADLSIDHKRAIGVAQILAELLGCCCRSTAPGRQHRQHPVTVRLSRAAGGSCALAVIDAAAGDQKLDELSHTLVRSLARSISGTLEDRQPAGTWMVTWPEHAS